MGRESNVKLFDVACLLSRWEGFGLVLPEYMLAGKPIVASKVDAIPDIITSGENGILVEPDNSEEVKNEILKLYENKNFRKKLLLSVSMILRRKMNWESYY